MQQKILFNKVMFLDPIKPFQILRNYFFIFSHISSLGNLFVTQINQS